MIDRMEYYKARGYTYEVTTCRRGCCHDGHFQDATEYKINGPVHCMGISTGSLGKALTLITRAEAFRREPRLKERRQRHDDYVWNLVDKDVNNPPDEA